VKETRERLAGETDFDLENPPSLVELLDRDKTRKMMIEFASSLYCDENILFYERARLFGLCTTDQGTRMRMAKAILDEFISPNGSKTLNTESVEREEAFASYEAGAPNFDKIVNTVLTQVCETIFALLILLTCFFFLESLQRCIKICIGNFLLT
jgi:hypothetical protein